MIDNILQLMISQCVLLSAELIIIIITFITTFIAFFTTFVTMTTTFIVVSLWFCRMLYAAADILPSPLPISLETWNTTQLISWKRTATILPMASLR